MRLEHRIQKLERAAGGCERFTGPGALTRVLDILAAQVYQGHVPTEAERELMDRVRWPHELEAGAKRVYGDTMGA